MNTKTPLDPPLGSCCPGSSHEDPDSCGGPSGCACTPQPKGPRWIKPLISGIVLMAALVVGIASLNASRKGGQAEESACCPAPITIEPVGLQEYGIGGSTVDDSTLAPANSPADSSHGN